MQEDNILLSNLLKIYCTFSMEYISSLPAMGNSVSYCSGALLVLAMNLANYVECGWGCD